LITSMIMATDMDAVSHRRPAFAGNLDLPPPTGQLTIFCKQKNTEVLSTKHALYLIKIFLNTCLEILTIPLQILSFNFCKESELVYIFSPSVNFLDIKIFPLFCMLVFYTALFSMTFYYNSFSDIFLKMYTLRKYGQACFIP